MKKEAYFFGMLLLLTLILVSCPNPAGGGGLKASIGDTLVLSGQVYTQEIDLAALLTDPDNILVIKPFNASLSIDDDGLGGSGSITNGQLNYTIGTPGVLGPINLVDINDEGVYTNFSVSDPAAQGAFCVLEISGSSEYYNLLKMLTKITNMDINPMSMKAELSFSATTVMYVYVDRDVVVSAEGSTIKDNDAGMDIEITARDFSLKLKEGWNVIHAVSQQKMDLIQSKMEMNLRLSAGEPSGLRWILL